MGYKNKTCIICCFEYTPTSGTSLCCSKKCRRENSRRKERLRYSRKNKLISRKCFICNKSFSTSDSRKVYCGSEPCDKARRRINNRNGDKKRLGKRSLEKKVHYLNNREVILSRKKEKYRAEKDYKVSEGWTTVKKDFGEVKEVFDSEGYKLITTEDKYKNTHQKLLVVCPKGHKWRVSYHSFSGKNPVRCFECNKFFFQSKPEKEIVDYFLGKGLELEELNRSVLEGKELDLFFPRQKIAVEYCGLRWHGELFSGRPTNYHRKKMEDCISKGIRLITIFEDEFIERPEVVLSRIDNALGACKNKVFARKCEVREIHSREANAFLEQHHLQGKSNTTCCWGLYYKDTLVQVLTVGSLSRTHAKYKGKTLELKRLASLPGYVIVGGANKLFTRAKIFAGENDYKYIKSYCDLRWANPFSTVYEKLGFKMISESRYTPHYFKGQVRYRNQGLRKTPEERKTGKTEWELRQEQGFDRIWDCGHKTYIYEV